MLGAALPPKIFGQIVKCNSSTKPARNRASFNSPPPSQSIRLTPHFARSQRERGSKIDFAFAANLHFVGDGPQIAGVSFSKHGPSSK